MSDALPLPPRSRLERYRKLAKDLVETSKLDEPAATRQWAERWLVSLAKAMREDPRKPEVQQLVEGGVEWLDRTWSRILKEKKRDGRGTLTDAQFLIARAHGFESWPKFSNHVKLLERGEGSPYEMAADAIVDGEMEVLRALLHKHPSLPRERSGREHHSTLLHYVSANGIEDFRQRTPPNIVEIARLLLEAGADVNVESDAYRGRSTPLELTATSIHPENAGVQIELMTLLLEHGALIDGVRGDSIVNACLHNGRGEAAEFLANRGARLDLEGAAGTGKLDVVRSFFDKRGRLIPPATRQQLLDGFAWACEFGRADVVAFLLEHGVGAADKLPQNGATGLHWAAYEGHSAIVGMLLDRGAPTSSRDDRFDGTPLDWAIHGWGHISPKRTAGRQYHKTVELLVLAGARLAPGWFDDAALAARLRADDAMRAALGVQLR